MRTVCAIPHSNVLCRSQPPEISLPGKLVGRFGTSLTMREVWSTAAVTVIAITTPKIARNANMPTTIRRRPARAACPCGPTTMFTVCGWGALAGLGTSVCTPQ